MKSGLSRRRHKPGAILRTAVNPTIIVTDARWYAAASRCVVVATLDSTIRQQVLTSLSVSERVNPINEQFNEKWMAHRYITVVCKLLKLSVAAKVVSPNFFYYK